MKIRADLQPVEGLISRLIAIGGEFRRNDQRWSHLKHQEDFSQVTRIPSADRHKVEAVYGTGRDMGNFMSNALISINDDFATYPTLTSVVTRLEASWVAGEYDEPDVALAVCKQHGVRLWSIEQMAALFKSQIEMLGAVRVTLNILKESDLYKLENGMPIDKQTTSGITISGVQGSNINIASPGSTQTLRADSEAKALFAAIAKAIESETIEQTEKEALLDGVRKLESAHAQGTFNAAYKEFMQDLSAHITVFTPFIPALAKLLGA